MGATQAVPGAWKGCGELTQHDVGYDAAQAQGMRVFLGVRVMKQGVIMGDTQGHPTRQTLTFGGDQPVKLKRLLGRRLGYLAGGLPMDRPSPVYDGADSLGVVLSTSRIAKPRVGRLQFDLYAGTRCTKVWTLSVELGSRAHLPPGLANYARALGCRLRFSRKNLVATDPTTKETVAIVGRSSAAGFFVAWNTRAGLGPFSVEAAAALLYIVLHMK